MSTRGFVGIKIDGKIRGSYNHSDSYWDGLGDDVVRCIRWLLSKYTISQLQTMARNLKTTHEDLEENGIDSPYLHYIFKEGIIPDDSAFLNDTLFCEYAYILNLDNLTLECYTGGTSELRGVFAIDNIPESWIDRCKGRKCKDEED